MEEAAVKAQRSKEMSVEQAKAKATEEAQRDNEQMLRGVVEKYEHLKEMAVEEGRSFLKMKQVMRLVARLGRQEGVWHKNRSDCDAVSITTLWSTIWCHLDPFLRTKTDKVNVKKEDKSRKGQISWRTCYNKLSRKGQLKGNQLRKPRLGMMDLRDLPFSL